MTEKTPSEANDRTPAVRPSPADPQVVIFGQEYVPVSWAGLLRCLDAAYPADIFTGESGDPGPRIVALSRRVQALEKLAGEMLACFTEKGHPGRSSKRSTWVPTEVVERWDGQVYPSRRGTSPASDGPAASAANAPSREADR